MKTISIACIAILTLASGAAIAQTNQSGNSLTVNLSGIGVHTGQVFMAVCNEAGFNGNGACEISRIVPISESSHPVIFENIPTGTYGVKLYHDVNGNNRLDSNAMGIPREPFGYSNNAKARFGPAKFKDAAFLIDKNITISINLEGL